MSNPQQGGELLLLAAVTWEVPMGPTRSSKLKVYRSDCDGKSMVTGNDLEGAVRRELGEDVLIEVYDPSQSIHVPLFEALEEDIVQRFGTRLRMTVRPSNSTDQDGDKLAIMGRFYSYDAAQGVAIAGKKLKVHEIANQENAGTGVNVWDGALLLAQYLEKEPSLVQGKLVLELGAGCGVVGLAAGILGAKEVLLTDLPYALPNMEANVRRHSHVCGDSRMECRALDWYDPPSWKDLGGIMMTSGDWIPNVILVADCVWMQELVEPLLNTLQQLTPDDKERPMKVLVSYQRRGKSTHEEFWTGLHTRFDNQNATVTEIDVSQVGLSKPDVLSLLCLEFGNGEAMK